MRTPSGDSVRLLARVAALFAGGTALAAALIAVVVIVVGGGLAAGLYWWNLEHCVAFCTVDYIRP